MQKISYLYLVVAIVVLVLLIIFLRGKEDDWIKDANGIYIEHGNPKATPSEVAAQQAAIQQAQAMFATADLNKQDLSNGPCLGQAEEYAVDVAHQPRQSVDDEEANQCPDYLSGKLIHFIELDQKGEVIKIK